MAFLTKLDHVAETLRERIIAGEYERGQKLKQGDIAAEMGVSVTPVREALKVLEMEGYVVAQPHKGPYVPEVDYDEVQEIYELRLMLERELTLVAAARMTQEGLERLRAAQKEFISCSKAGDLFAARAANVRFHFRLYELANRPRTLQFVRVLWARYPFNYRQQQAVRLKHIEKEHDLCLRYLEAGDVTAAANAMCAHITSGWVRVESIIQSELEKDKRQ